MDQLAELAPLPGLVGRGDGMLDAIRDKTTALEANEFDSHQESSASHAIDKLRRANWNGYA